MNDPIICGKMRIIKLLVNCCSQNNILIELPGKLVEGPVAVMVEIWHVQYNAALPSAPIEQNDSTCKHTKRTTRGVQTTIRTIEQEFQHKQRSHIVWCGLDLIVCTVASHHYAITCNYLVLENACALSNVRMLCDQLTEPAACYFLWVAIRKTHLNFISRWIM